MEFKGVYRCRPGKSRDSSSAALTCALRDQTSEGAAPGPLACVASCKAAVEDKVFSHAEWFCRKPRGATGVSFKLDLQQVAGLEDAQKPTCRMFFLPKIKFSVTI